MNPVDNPEAYDVIILAGQRSPGVCKVRGAKREEGWDEQKAKGADGAETVPVGRPLAKFSVDLKLWKEDELDCFALWDAWKKILGTPVKSGQNKALDIYHPQLADLGISSVVVKAWSDPDPDGKGAGMVTIDFLEYRPTKPKPIGKPKGSATTPGTPASPDPNDPNADVKAEAKYYEEKLLRMGGPF